MQAIQTMSALAQATRMEVFRLLVTALPRGMAASDIADATRTSRASMSAHLAILERAGIVGSEKAGRSVIYTARPRAIQKLAAFLIEASHGATDVAGEAGPTGG